MNEILNLLNPWWFNKSFETGINRPVYKKTLLKSLKNKQATLIVGPRRVGKTTLIYQIIKEALGKINPQHILYVLVDHPQLSTYSILELVHDYRKQFVLNRNTKLYLFFDEIQYIKDWEREIKALIDTENVKIFLSGSSSSTLLIKSSYLTGRIEKTDIFPLDFNEFLMFKKFTPSETENYKLEKYTDEYLKTGGYPEYVLKKNPAYFADLVNNILYKDIVNFYQLKNPEILKDILLLLADRVGHQTTYSKLSKIVTVKMDTVKEYIYYLKNTFLVDELARYSSSRAVRIYGPKKFYILDNGILFHLLGRLSYGSAFEQTLFNYYKKNNVNASFYYENQNEIDFIIKNKNKVELWEVKYKIEPDFDIKLPNYIKMAKSISAKKIVFVTKKETNKKIIDNINIEFIPLWQLLKT